MSGRRTIIRNQISGEITHQGSIAGRVQQATIRSQRAAKGRIKSSTIAVYASIFVLLVVLIAIGYRNPQQVSGVANTANTPLVITEESDTPVVVNDVVASSIAANVATTTNLSVAPSVTSLAISTQIESELPTSDASSISKPQIIEVSAASRNITSYTVKSGDTIDSLAAQFGISKQTIKWANDMVSDSLVVGTRLQILPTDGIAYTVRGDDTIQKLAEKYKSDASLITTYNDLDLTGIKSGLKIIIPGGQLPTNERPGYVTQSQFTYGSYYFQQGSSGNRYAPGNCTWYAYERRVQLGRPIGSFWGNARTWDDAARQSSKYTVNNKPLPGAIMVMEDYQAGNGAGHVAVVESVDGRTGDVYISEMNYGYNFNRVTNRTITAGQAALYQYVH